MSPSSVEFSTSATRSVIPMIGFFFALSVLSSGFGVADTRVVFSLAPRDAPTRVFVLAAVTTSLAGGLAPLLGLALDLALEGGIAPLSAYRALFAIAGVMSLMALIPLRRFPR